MAATSNLPDLKKIAAELDKLGLKHDVVASIKIASLRYEKAIQVRDLDHIAPKHRINEFAVKMTHGEVFPPIVITSDGVVVEGHTRTEAYKITGRADIPAVVLQVAFESADDKTIHLLRVVAGTFNDQGALPMTDKEIRGLVEDYLALGYSAEQVAIRHGIKSQTFSAIKREIAAEKRMEQVGVEWRGNKAKKIRDRLNQAARRKLGSTDILKLHDVQYKNLAELARDAGLNTSEIGETAKALGNAGSDEAELGILSQQRIENETRIRERKLTGDGKPPASRKLLQHLGFINNYEGRVSDLLEVSPKLMGGSVESIDQSIKILTTLRDLQQARVDGAGEV